MLFWVARVKAFPGCRGGRECPGVAWTPGMPNAVLADAEQPLRWCSQSSTLCPQGTWDCGPQKQGSHVKQDEKTLELLCSRLGWATGGQDWSLILPLPVVAAAPELG